MLNVQRREPNDETKPTAAIDQHDFHQCRPEVCWQIRQQVRWRHYCARWRESEKQSPSKRSWRTSQHGCGSHQSKFSLRLSGRGEHKERAKVLDLLAIAPQALSPLSCAVVKALSLASVASRIVNPILVPLWRSASDCQLTRPQKRVRWQSQGVQTRSRHWQPAL